MNQHYCESQTIILRGFIPGGWPKTHHHKHICGSAARRASLKKTTNEDPHQYNSPQRLDDMQDHIGLLQYGHVNHGGLFWFLPVIKPLCLMDSCGSAGGCCCFSLIATRLIGDVGN